MTAPVGKLDELEAIEQFGRVLHSAERMAGMVGENSCERCGLEFRDYFL
ncbi:MAG: hypothetical protein IT539_13850 [Bradyrhizobiaceae bacterium]|nr:hypothetical protein [Bradyrhizobiaceae bacterium]